MTDFEALVREHQAAVCATAYAMLRDRARSEEIAQDAFLVAWRKLPELPAPPPLPAWICGIARNLARNAIRKHSEVPMTDTTREPQAASTPLDQALSREQLDVASRALGSLDEADREVVALYYRADESIAAVAAALAIPEATARKRLQRTRERLRAAVAQVEAMLRASRPGPAFTVACVAALAAGRVVDASAATIAGHEAAAGSAARSAGRKGAGGKAAGVVAAAGVLLVAAGAGIAIHARGSTEPAASAPAAGSSAIATGAGSAATGAAVPSARTRGFLEKITHDERVAVLARAHAAQPAPAALVKPLVYDFAGTKLADVTLPEKIPTGPLGKATLRYAIKLIQPMLLACVTDEQAHGTLEVHMYLTGDAEATVVESVEITGKPPLSDDHELVECVRTTLESLELPPRKDTTPWDVYYPFVL